MSMMMRYILAAFIMLGAAIFAISPFASTFIEQWSRRDVELRSNLVFNSVRDELANLLAVGATAQIDELFDRLALDERLLAVGFCDDAPGKAKPNVRNRPSDSRQHSIGTNPIGEATVEGDVTGLFAGRACGRITLD